MDTVKRSRILHSSVDCKRRGATPRGSTRVRSRSQSVRNLAITRWNACSPIAWQALRRPRILLWGVSGQKPRLTKDGKSIICKTDNFVPLVVPGISTNPESGSFGPSSSQDSLRKDAERATRQLVPPASSSSSSSVSERSDELATKTLVPFPEIQNQKKRSDRKDSEDPLADLPDWLKDFKENQKETELHVSAHSSPESDEHPVSGNEIEEATCFYSLPKRPRLRCLLENLNNKGSLQKTYWRSSTSCRKVWWLDYGRSQSPRPCYSMDSILSV